MKLVIIAGGKGTRLGLKNIPKPMVEINGKPILQYQIELAKRYGFFEVYILTGHLSQVIEKYFLDGKKFGVKITYFREISPHGTAGSLKKVQNFLKERFMVFYGDTIMDINLKKMIEFDSKHRSLGTLLVHPNDHPYDSDLLEIEDESFKIKGFFSKPHDSSYKANLVNAALYILSPEILNYIPENKNLDFGKDIFPKIINVKSGLYAYKSTEYIKDMGTPDRLEKISKDLKNGKVERLNYSNKRKAIFIDRDGVINKEVDELVDIEDFELIPGVEAAIKKINQSEYLAILITNQPMIAKGKLKVSELKKIHNKLESLLGLKGAYLDDIFFCPHHPELGFAGEIKSLKINCNCRKPNIGMIQKSEKLYNIDLRQSYIIGDRTADIKCGENAKLITILVKTGHAGKDLKYNIKPNFIFNNFTEAINHIL
jgi:mannose-1-phosphate guanylyltransferase/phosphomannomutase